MRLQFILLFKLMNRFGPARGWTIFYKNTIVKKGISTFRLKEPPNPIALRRGTSDIPTFYHIFLNRGYYFKTDFTPKFIVDCGANIGLASLYFKSVYPEAQIVAIEPEQSNFDMLIKNTEKYKGIECIKGGVWNKSAILKIEDEFKIGKWGFVCREVEKEDATTIKAFSLDDIMSRFSQVEIDILKIDIESSEFELFSSNYEHWLPRTKAIVIELHDWLKKGCSRAFFTALLRYDFSIFQCGEGILAMRN